MAKQGEHGIAWTEETWNPIRGCTRVSEGCRNCYAERVAARFSDVGQPYHGLARLVPVGHDDRTGAVLKTVPRWTGDVMYVKDHILDPVRWRKPRLIFVNSMSDLFHPGVPDEWIDRIVAVMALAEQHTFQVLTKRPERMLQYLVNLSNGGDKTIERLGDAIFMEAGGEACQMLRGRLVLPLPNVWWGTSAEDQETFDKRTCLLKQTPAAVRWLSLEPLLGPIDMGKVTIGTVKGKQDPLLYSAFWEGTIPFDEYDVKMHKIDWVVVGGESGPGARPMNAEWARDIRDECIVAGVPYFFKQWGEWLPFGQESRGADGGPIVNVNETVPFIHIGKRMAGRLLDGKEWSEYPKGWERAA